MRVTLVGFYRHYLGGGCLAHLKTNSQTLHVDSRFLPNYQYCDDEFTHYTIRYEWTAYRSESWPVIDESFLARCFQSSKIRNSRIQTRTLGGWRKYSPEELNVDVFNRRLLHSTTTNWSMEFWSKSSTVHETLADLSEEAWRRESTGTTIQVVWISSSSIWPHTSAVSLPIDHHYLH